MNPLAFLFMVIPPIVVMFLHHMTFKYCYNLSRNLTEKEYVARKRYASSQKINDDVVDAKLSYWQCTKNIWSHLVRKNPKSVLEIAKTFDNNPIEPSEGPQDQPIEGMQNDSFDSSSSEDEIPEFLKPKPLNIIYAPQPPVLIVGGDGKQLCFAFFYFILAI